LAIARGWSVGAGESLKDAAARLGTGEFDANVVEVTANVLF